MSAADLCQIRSCRVVDFMVHDRSSFGGVMCGVGVLYVWMVVFPLEVYSRFAWGRVLSFSERKPPPSAA